MKHVELSRVEIFVLYNFRVKIKLEISHKFFFFEKRILIFLYYFMFVNILLVKNLETEKRLLRYKLL